MTRRIDTNQTQPLLSSAQKVSFGEFGTTNLSADQLVFTPDFAKSVYSAIYDNSFGRTSTTSANSVGEHLAFFPEVCIQLRTQMEGLRYTANAESIRAFLTNLCRMNHLIQEQNKKNIESDNAAIHQFATNFAEQVNRIFSYVSTAYLDLGPIIQRIGQNTITPFTQSEISEFAPINQGDRERNVYCSSRLQAPGKLFMPAIALDVYRQLINFSDAKHLTHLYVESDALAIRDLIENASTLADYILLIAKLTGFQNKSSDSDYSELLKAIAEQIGAYISVTRLDIVALLNQQLNLVKNDLDAKRSEACSQCGKAVGCGCLALLAHPAYAYFAFFSPVFLAGEASSVLPVTFTAMAEFGVLIADWRYVLPKSCEYGRLFCQARVEANQLSTDLSNIASAKAVAAPKPREMC